MPVHTHARSGTFENEQLPTPYRGHPVFVAQHATATCCRTCLQRWHEIPKGRDLSRAERAYVVTVICRWIEREVASAAARAVGRGLA
ncbi:MULTISPECIES: DUF4186 family protein [unclassified Streptomyces]|uniref:DUF4186 family protein n=1 Tax=unclassified Streptomyces TaxID=2593676 RepID=UPI003D920313